MLKRCLSRTFVRVIVTVIYTFVAAGSQAADFESEIKSIAGALVSRMEASGQKSGTVLDLTDLQGQGNELGRFLAQELSNALVGAAKTMSFVDRANLQFLLRENRLSADGLINPESSRKLGNLIGIDTLVVGTVTPVGRSYRLSVRAIAVETGRIIVSQSISLSQVPDIGQTNILPLPGSGGPINPAQNQPSGASVQSGQRSQVAPAPAPIPAPAKPDVRSRFRADSLKMTVSPASYSETRWRLNFTIENRSGIPISLAAVGDSSSLQGCQFAEILGIPIVNSSDTDWVKRNQISNFVFIPSGGQLTASANFFSFMCTLKGMNSGAVSISLMIHAENDVFMYTASAQASLIR